MYVHEAELCNEEVYEVQGEFVDLRAILSGRGCSNGEVGEGCDEFLADR